MQIIQTSSLKLQMQRLENEPSLMFYHTFFFLAVPSGMRNLSSLAKDRTRAPYGGSV